MFSLVDVEERMFAVLRRHRGLIVRLVGCELLRGLARPFLHWGRLLSNFHFKVLI